MPSLSAAEWRSRPVHCLSSPSHIGCTFKKAAAKALHVCCFVGPILHRPRCPPTMGSKSHSDTKGSCLAPRSAGPGCIVVSRFAFICCVRTHAHPQHFGRRPCICGNMDGTARPKCRDHRINLEFALGSEVLGLKEPQRQSSGWRLCNVARSVAGLNLPDWVLHSLSLPRLACSRKAGGRSPATS